MEQLSPEDASLLYAETPQANANVSLLHIYDQRSVPGGVLRFKTILAHIESRLSRSMVFRRKLQRVPLELDHPFDGLMTVACRPEAIGVVVEDPLEERTQEEPQHFLSNAIADGGDTQWTSFPIPLGDMDATQRRGSVRPILETLHQGQQVLFEIALVQLDADLVDPGRAPVTFDVPESEA